MQQNLSAGKADVSFQVVILIEHLDIFVSFCNFFLREREKFAQREGLWQQVETMAKTNPEWTKIVGQMDSLSISSSQNEFDQDNENCDLTYDKLDYEESQQQQQQAAPQHLSIVQENREVCSHIYSKISK